MVLQRKIKQSKVGLNRRRRWGIGKGLPSYMGWSAESSLIKYNVNRYLKGCKKELPGFLEEEHYSQGQYQVHRL